jgi:hypothetical protein
MHASDVIAISACVISLLAFCVALATLLHERKQRRVDNLVRLHAFLHQDELSKARKAVREAHFPDNLDDEVFRRVCSSFDFAGTLVRHGAVDKLMFLDYWAIPLLTLEPRMVAVADVNTGDVQMKRYYRDFYWLIREANSMQEKRPLSR